MCISLLAYLQLIPIIIVKHSKYIYIDYNYRRFLKIRKSAEFLDGYNRMK